MDLCIINVQGVPEIDEFVTQRVNKVFQVAFFLSLDKNYASCVQLVSYFLKYSKEMESNLIFSNQLYQFIHLL